MSTNHQIITERIIELRDALTKQLPTLPSLLRTIHDQLRADPEVVTLLTEEQVEAIIAGLEVQTKRDIYELVEKPAKEKKAKGALKEITDKVKKGTLSADDI
jgi:hypothetical protein